MLHIRKLTVYIKRNNKKKLLGSVIIVLINYKFTVEKTPNYNINFYCFYYIILLYSCYVTIITIIAIILLGKLKCIIHMFAVL